MRIFVIFDMDGTLYDLYAPFAEAACQCLKEETPSDDVLKQIFAASRRYSDVLRAQGVNDAEQLVRQRNRLAFSDFGQLLSEAQSIELQRAYASAQAHLRMEPAMRNLLACLREAGVESPVDMNHIKLALQGYNYGNGYISWAKENYGGYTYANAVEFSEMMAERNGWSSYGDKEYVSHVLRYYVFGRIPTGTGSQAIVQVALTQEGNGGDTYWSWYGFSSREEWCACFVSWCADQCGYIEAGVIPKFSLCSAGMEWFESRGQFMDGSYVPATGDLVFFDWGNDGSVDHVGIVESVVDGNIYTVEGNSGDKVARRSYPIGYGQIVGYGVPAY